MPFKPDSAPSSFKADAQPASGAPSPQPEGGWASLLGKAKEGYDYLDKKMGANDAQAQAEMADPRNQHTHPPTMSELGVTPGGSLPKLLMGSLEAGSSIPLAGGLFKAISKLPGVAKAAFQAPEVGGAAQAASEAASVAPSASGAASLAEAIPSAAKETAKKAYKWSFDKIPLAKGGGQ